jgi:trehalose 6-phosphate synthase
MRNSNAPPRPLNPSSPVMKTPIIATIRPPVGIRLENGSLVAQREKGSVTALLSTEALVLGLTPLWISTVDPAIADMLRKESEEFSDLPYPLHPVAIELGQIEAAYDFATRILWFCHHDLLDDYPPDGTEHRSGYQAFLDLNFSFAMHIADVVDPETPVVINDYQLCMVPAALRLWQPTVPVLHMSYTAFADDATWLRLPHALRLAMLDGMLGADIVAFTARRWAHNFVRCVLRFMDAHYAPDQGAIVHPRGTTFVRTRPVFANPNRVTALAGTAQTFASPAPSRISLARADRLDPAKNIIRGFEAFEHLLRGRSRGDPELHFTACLVPTRQTLWEYRQYTETVLELIDRINRRFSESISVHLGDDHPRALKAAIGSDVFLANSLADGMNLTVQEFALVNRRGGGLVLSEQMGSAAFLQSCADFISDPRSVDRTAKRIEHSIALPLITRLARSQRAQGILATQTPFLDRALTDIVSLPALSSK